MTPVISAILDEISVRNGLFVFVFVLVVETRLKADVVVVVREDEEESSEVALNWLRLLISLRTLSFSSIFFKACACSSTWSLAGVLGLFRSSLQALSVLEPMTSVLEMLSLAFELSLAALATQ